MSSQEGLQKGVGAVLLGTGVEKTAEQRERGRELDAVSQSATQACS